MPPKHLRILYHHRTRARDGQSVHIDELVKAFRAEGHQVSIVEPQRIDAMRQGVERDLLPKALYELLELAFSGIEFVRLFVAAQLRRPDLIYQRANLHMVGAVWLSRLMHIPLFVEVNAPLAEERGKFGGLAWPRLAAWSEHYLWRKATRVLPVTEVLARRIEAAGVPRANITVVANGVDMGRFATRGRDAAKTALDLKGHFVLGFVGYVREWHGLEQVIDLLAKDSRLANGHLIIVGDGPARTALTARARALGVSDRVFFTGVVAREDVAAIASAFDVALQPEVTAYASPLKLFEYMALGHAIVAPDSANIREVLSHEVDALLFAPGHHAAFAEAVARLAGDAALREQLGANAIANLTAKNRTWRGNARRIAALGPIADAKPRDAENILSDAELG
jgi:glycosyltransferase involved in cell wall biosynthesis